MSLNIPEVTEEGGGTSDKFISETGEIVECSTIENCAENSCSSSGCTQCVDGYYLTEEGQCSACSDSLEYCATCSSADQCTTCSHESLKVDDSGYCVCDNTGKEDTMIRNEED